MRVRAVLLAWGALLARDLRAVARSRSQLYSSLLFPALLLVLLGTGVSEGLDPGKVRDGDYVSYLLPGMVVMTAVFSSTFSSASYYRDRDTGLLKTFLASPHTPRVILLGKALGGVAIGGAQALVLLAVAAPVPAVHLAWQYGLGVGIALALVGVGLLTLLLAGLAQLLASRIRTMQGFHLVMNLVLFPLLFLSGAFFPLGDLPEWLTALGRLDPLSYAVDLLHLAAYADTSEGSFGLAVDLPVLAALAVGVFWLGFRQRDAGTLAALG